jgi:hypothetical protein
MADIKIELEVTDKTMADLRPRLDAALAKNFPGGMLQRRWDGDVLHLTGPGADGTIVLEGGNLIGRASLRPPASLMKTMIEEKIASALRDVAGADVAGT